MSRSSSLIADVLGRELVATDGSRMAEHVDDGRGRFFRANVRIDAGATQYFDLEMDQCYRRRSRDGSVTLA
jgi:hypothetical protein